MSVYRTIGPLVFLFVVIAAGVELCGGPKVALYIVYSAVYIFLLVL